ncbi:MAG: TonB-dependent siderophore receptor [Pelomonas sp.]|nr:TonB-dependent siderophore receptor [Roseateles sp.]
MATTQKFPLRLTACAAAAAALLPATALHAQTALPTVSVTGHAANTPVEVGGWGDTPVAKLPLQADVISADQLKDTGTTQLSGLTSLDASTSDAYNAIGYVSYLSVRGFQLDNRFNYRRDGLPINAETALPLADVASVELLKGTSGIQAGTSAPGGLVDLVVKRPTVQDFTTLGLGFVQSGTVETTLDASRQLGNGFALRVNVEAAQLDPALRDAKGNSRLLSAALDWRASPTTLVQLEGEVWHQAERDQPGFSLLGTALPDPRKIDPNINLNDQPWSLPSVFDGRTASLRVRQQLNADWSVTAHGMVQRLSNDDRLAFPFGCTASDGTYWSSSYCPNGNFDLYDFRSNGEHRNSTALQLTLDGRVATGALTHQVSAGVLRTALAARFNGEAYNYVGTGNIDGQVFTPADPAPLAANTNRDERSTEFFVRDAIAIDAQWQAWLGLRHTRLARATIGTDGSAPTAYTQSCTTPWAGVGYSLSRTLMLYASWGEGVESQFAPNLPQYTNAGQALPALKSRQTEVGVKSGTNTVDWSLAAFDIRQPAARDVGACDGTTGSCTTKVDGSERHRGLEAAVDFKWQGGSMSASAMHLRARREGSADARLDGLMPTNVPSNTLKLQLREDVAAGLQAQGGLVYEGPRAVLPDNSLMLPGWTRLDAGLRYAQQTAGAQYVWRVGVDNLANRRAWRESPYQYAHVYLYPLAPRTFRASLEVQL